MPQNSAKLSANQTKRKHFPPPSADSVPPMNEAAETHQATLPHPYETVILHHTSARSAQCPMHSRITRAQADPVRPMLSFSLFSTQSCNQSRSPLSIANGCPSVHVDTRPSMR